MQSTFAMEMELHYLEDIVVASGIRKDLVETVTPEGNVEDFKKLSLEASSSVKKTKTKFIIN